MRIKVALTEKQKNIVNDAVMFADDIISGRLLHHVDKLITVNLCDKEVRATVKSMVGHVDEKTKSLQFRSRPTGAEFDFNALSVEESVRIILALDVYFRTIMGQFEIIEEYIRTNVILEDSDVSDRFLILNDIEYFLKAIKRQNGIPANGNFGLSNENIDDSARAAYDIKKSIEYVIAWEKEGKDPEKDGRDFSTMLGNNYDKPSQTAFDKKDYPLPVAEIIKERGMV